VGTMLATAFECSSHRAVVGARLDIAENNGTDIVLGENTCHLPVDGAVRKRRIQQHEQTLHAMLSNQVAYLLMRADAEDDLRRALKPGDACITPHGRVHLALSTTRNGGTPRRRRWPRWPRAK